jgi:hypothetical protein
MAATEQGEQAHRADRAEPARPEAPLRRARDGVRRGGWLRRSTPDNRRGRRRGGSGASHAASLAQKLVGWLARGGACCASRERAHASACARPRVCAFPFSFSFPFSFACSLALAFALVACDDDPSSPPIDPDDVDGDGVPNAQDLCPGVRDPAQHDEDGDGVGDLCDVCPTVADPLQSDTGELDAISFNDGVGDACDPRPIAGGDRIGALHTFAADTTPAWIGAGFTISGDRVRATAAATATTAARWLHMRPVSGDSIAARLAVESIAWAGAAAGEPGPSIAIALDGDGAENARVCGVFADRNGDGNDELEARELAGAVAVRELPGTVSGAGAGPFTLLAQRGVDRRRGTGIVYCRLVLPDRPDAPITTTIPTTDDATTGQYAIVAAEAEVIATSLVVYASPYACPTLSLAACDSP